MISTVNDIKPGPTLVLAKLLVQINDLGFLIIIVECLAQPTVVTSLAPIVPMLLLSCIKG